MPRAARTADSARSRAAATLRRSAGALSTAATAEMEATLPWYRELSAEERSWVGMILQAGVRGFVDWYGTAGEAGPDGHPRPRLEAPAEGTALAASVFGVAPRALAGVISLQQTVALVRAAFEAVDANVDSLLEPEGAADVRSALARYSREVAFATAEVYARAAEARGAWDARLEALVVDAVLRAEADEAVLGRASALGWTAQEQVLVVIGPVPRRRSEADLFEDVRRVARAHQADTLCAVQGDRLVVLLGGVEEDSPALAAVGELFGDGPVVSGPAAESLASAHLSARAALAGLRAAPGWPDAPRPVAATDLLPERVLAGDGHARRHLVEEIYLPLAHGRGALVETLAAYLDSGGSLEATGRRLFIHPNTVRYRLRQVADLTGLHPARPREAFTLQIALALGRQSGRSTTVDL